ncbi:MAG: hypothetical protein AAFX09_12145 [Pseudomonadota bacterium]
MSAFYNLGRIILVVAVFLGVGVFTIVRFDTHFMDFVKIARCAPDGYERGDYMMACSGIDAHRYHFGSIVLGVQDDAVRSLQNADVVVLGNSRTLRSFATTAIDDYFATRGLTYFVMATEGASYRAAMNTLQQLDIRPPVLLVNNELFFSDQIDEGMRDLIDFPDRYRTRFEFFHAAQQLQSWACRTNAPVLSGWMCNGGVAARWRSAQTGQVVWSLEASDEDNTPLNIDPTSRITAQRRLQPNLDEFMQSRPVRATCPILYIVDSPVSSPQLMERMAAEHNLDTVFVGLPGLQSYDGSHLDRPNSELWAQAFVDKLEGPLDRCLSGEARQRLNDAPVDPAFVSDAESATASFADWTVQGAVTIIENAASGSTDETDAAVFDFAERGPRVRRVMRETAVNAGDTVTFSMWLRSEDFASVRLQIVRACSRAPVETHTELVTLSRRFERYDAQLTFEQDHPCIVVMLQNISEATQVEAWRYQVEVTPAASEPDAPAEN